VPRWHHVVNIQGITFIVAIAVVWEILADTVFSGFDSIASTTETLAGLGDLITQGELLSQIGHTLSVTVIGWILAGLIGLIIGISLGLSPWLWKYSMATIEVLRSIPSISFVPVALMLFGFSQTMELVVIVYVSLWPVLMGSLGGVRGVNPQLVDVARTLRLGPWRKMRRIVFPAALPNILVGLRLSLSLSIALAVIAEMLGNPRGLGFGIIFSQRAFLPAEVFAYLLVIGLIGWLVNALFVLLIRRMAPTFAGAI